MILNNDLFRTPIRVVNVGLFEFYQALQDQSVPTIHVDWRPPAGGNREMRDLLARLRPQK